MNSLYEFYIIIRRYKTESVLNMIGMALAFGIAYLLFVQAWNDITFNRNIPDGDRIFRVELMDFEGKYSCAVSPTFIFAASGIRGVAEESGAVSRTDNLQAISSKKGKEKMVMRERLMTINAMHALGITPVNDSIGTLANIRKIGISQHAASRYGLHVGDTLKDWKYENEIQNVAVGLIYKDFPYNSDLGRIDAIRFMDYSTFTIDNISSSNWSFYTRLRSSADAGSYIDSLVKRLNKSEAEHHITNFQIRLTPVSDTYLASEVTLSDTSTGSLTVTLMFIAIAILVVTIAFINYFNFFIALIPRRIKAVNIHKMYGASINSIRIRIILESVGMVLASMILASVIIGMISSEFLVAPASGYLQQDLFSSSIMISDNIPVASFLIACGILLSVIIAIPPSYYITSFKPVFDIHRKNIIIRHHSLSMRYLLISIQYIISIVLIIVATTMRQQYIYLLNQDLGFNHTNVLQCNIPSSIAEQPSELKQLETDLRRNPAVKDVTFANGDFVSDNHTRWTYYVNNRPLNFDVYPVAGNFSRFFKIPLTEKRHEISPKDDGYMIFNRRAHNKLGLTLNDSIYGLVYKVNMGEENGKLTSSFVTSQSQYDSIRIGAFCGDFNYKPLLRDIQPFAFYVCGDSHPHTFNRLYVRTRKLSDMRVMAKYIARKMLTLQKKNEKRIVDSIGLDYTYIKNEKEKYSLKEIHLSYTLSSNIDRSYNYQYNGLDPYYNASENTKRNLRKMLHYYAVNNWQLKFIDKDANITDMNVLLKAYYKEQHRLSTLITTFSVIAIFISLLGIFGLVYIESRQREREIAIRRVSGATAWSIIRIFVLRYAIIITICFALATPLSIYLIDLWISNYTYRTPLSLWIFISALTIILFITALVVVVSSWRASHRNPVVVLQKE